jgi:hypothetical protein
MRQVRQRQSSVKAGGEGDVDGHGVLRAPLSAAARVRSKGEDFAACFAELKGLVSEVCDRQDEWEAKVIAAIRAITESAAASPAKALALTVEARRPGPEDQIAAHQVIAYFAERLGELAPRARRAPISNDESIIEAIALIFRGHLLAGTADQLPDAAPDLVYLALMPYLGLAETRGWTNALALRTGLGAPG